ncbi:MAG TPA: Mu transposase C-terminal domain-containing protein, partial [Armatimonadota bacterium]|nr:Mu transposase C-terminal domain-containing protein [Armatimonadota bacterium]
ASTVWQHLGVELVTAIPHQPWSKHIESLFGAWSRRNENLLPGYTGRRAEDRPEKLADELERGALLTIDQYVETLAGQIERWNGTHTVGTRRQPPIGYWQDYVPRYPDPQTLTFLLQDRRRQVVNHGRILLQAGKTQHLYISDALALYSGVAVEVLWDPGEPEWVWVYPGDGRCLAVREVPLAEYGEWGETNRLARAASRAQRQFVREWAAPIKGACPRELMDPTGAHQAVAARLENVRVAGAETGVKQLAQAQAKAQLTAETQPDEEETYYVDRNLERLNRRIG